MFLDHLASKLLSAEYQLFFLLLPAPESVPYKEFEQAFGAEKIFDYKNWFRFFRIASVWRNWSESIQTTIYTSLETVS